MAYQSGGIAVPGANQLLAPPALAIFDNTFFVLGGSVADSNGRMYQTTFDLQNLVRPSSPPPPPGVEPIDTDNLTNTDNWHMQNMWMPDNTPCTYSRCSAVSTPDNLYVFWNHFQEQTFSSSSALLASQYSTANNWGHTIQLLEMDGTTEPVPLINRSEAYYAVADVSVTLVGDNFIIVACAQATSGTNKTGGIFLGLYDTTKIDAANNTWIADWHTYIPISQLKFDAGPFANSGSYISIDWFSTVTQSGAEPVFYLAISVFPKFTNDSLFPVESSLPNGYIAYVPLSVSSAQTGTTVSINVPTTLQCCDVNSGKGQFVSPLVRDPAGRLRAYFLETLTSSFSLVQEGYYLTTNAPDPSSGLPFSDQTPLQFVTTGGGNAIPSILFYIFTPGAAATTFNGANATEYPIYEFIFTNTAYVNRYGTIQVLPDYATATLLPDTINVISGIIDGPLPLPLENYQPPYQFEDQIDGGDIIYGTTDTETISRQDSHNWTLGIQSSGQMTAGWGPAWQLSFNGGMGQVAGSSKQKILSYNLPQTALVIQGDGQTPLSINPYGHLRKVAAQFNATAYRFLDTNGNPVTDATTADPGQAPKLATVLTTFPDATLLQYVPYSVKPGNLMTYTPGQWNTTMQNLGYPGTNYYGEVICKNAYPLGSDQIYLEFSWSAGTPSAQAITKFTSSFIEHNWEVSTSLYAGVSWGAGVSIFGLGDQGQGQVLIGGTYSYNHSHTKDKQSGWGINSSLIWGPPVSGNSDAVIAYTFRVFFLPVPKPPSTLPPTYWTKELIDYMPAGSLPPGESIDPNSGCWRLVYVVTEIQCNDPTLNYSYDGSLDLKSVYQSDDSTKSAT